MIRALLVALVCTVGIACGTDSSLQQLKGGSATATDLPNDQGASTVAIDLPERLLPAALHGPWAMTRFRKKGATTGPSSWSKASVVGEKISLSSGEISKDSGSWTASGRYGVLDGQGSEERPFVMRMLVEQSRGGERHPTPVEVGQVVEFKIRFADNILSIDFPKNSMILARKSDISSVGREHGRPQDATPPSGPIETAFACAAQEDCLNSCNHGAVNKAWYIEQYPGGERCEGGCTSKGIEPARCIEGVCVAVRLGQRADECTLHKAEIIQSPGPAHSCSTDDDCGSYCLYGSTNNHWYKQNADHSRECRDGCGSKGSSSKCENGLCVGYMMGKRADHCTGLNIHKI